MGVQETVTRLIASSLCPESSALCGRCSFENQFSFCLIIGGLRVGGGCSGITLPCIPTTAPMSFSLSLTSFCSFICSFIAVQYRDCTHLRFISKRQQLLAVRCLACLLLGNGERSSAYLVSLLRGLREIIHMKPTEQCPTPNKHPANVSCHSSYVFNLYCWMLGFGQRVWSGATM